MTDRRAQGTSKGYVGVGTRRTNVPEEIVVWVPTGRIASRIRAGSGVVSSRPPVGGRITIDFEGNLYGSPALAVYANRVLHAWDRQHTDYPTVARLRAEAEDLIRVGTFDPEEGEICLTDPDAVEDNGGVLAAWLGVESVLDQELKSTGARYTDRRNLRAMLHSGDPTKIATAKWWAKSKGMPLPA